MSMILSKILWMGTFSVPASSAHVGTTPHPNGHLLRANELSHTHGYNALVASYLYNNELLVIRFERGRVIGRACRRNGGRRRSEEEPESQAHKVGVEYRGRRRGGGIEYRPPQQISPPAEVNRGVVFDPLKT